MLDHNKERNMKASRTVRAVAVAAVGSLTLAGLSLLSVNAADAAARSTVVIVSSNAMTSLNPGTPDTNLTINADIAYVSGAGFNYYDNKANLVKNTVFGSYKVVKNTAKDFRVQYTVNKGKVWSDGTPITGVDLLLTHVLASSKYSKAAGLGDPSNTDATPAFNSGGYGGPYDNHVVGEPTLSADQMSVTVRYDSFQPDWEIMGPGPAPVHTLELLAAGKDGIQSASANKAAKAKFLADFKGKKSSALKAMGKVWSNDYNIKTVNSGTNDLLLVTNGGYQVKSAVADQSVTLVANPKYNSGKKLSGIKTIVFKFIGDGTAASQALANREIDVYQGQPTADAVAQLKGISGVTTIGGTNSCFEHIDLRVGDGQGETDKYTGPFLGNSQKAKDLRTAFLLAYPRQRIIDTIVRPINSNAVVVNSVFLLPGQTGYNEVVKSSGVKKFSDGTQAERTAKALALVQKYYPEAGAKNQPININLLWGQPSNARRGAEAALVIAEEKLAGFNVSAPGKSGWGGYLTANNYDAAFFAWCPTSTSQTGTNANFLSDGENNFLGYANADLDKVLHSLEAKLSPKQIAAKYLAAEKILVADAVSLGIFQHPAVTSFTTGLKGIKPAPLTPNLVWNYWEWHF